MAQVALRMTLKPGAIDEYRRRHDTIWPELADVLKGAGIRNYWIHHDPETNLLFATMESDDPAAVEALAGTDVMRRWWTWMAPLMETNSDHSPVTVSLDTIFHLD